MIDFEITLIQVKVFGYQSLNPTESAWANQSRIEMHDPGDSCMNWSPNRHLKMGSDYVTNCGLESAQELVLESVVKLARDLYAIWASQSAQESVLEFVYILMVESVPQVGRELGVRIGPTICTIIDVRNGVEFGD